MRKRVIELCLIARPDLFILNPGLSDGNGLLRQQPDLRSLPLVVYSGTRSRTKNCRSSGRAQHSS